MDKFVIHSFLHHGRLVSVFAVTDILAVEFLDGLLGINGQVDSVQIFVTTRCPNYWASCQGIVGARV